MIRRLSSIALTLALAALAREASAQMQTAPMNQSSRSGGFVSDEGVDRAGGMLNGLLGFAGRTGGGLALGFEGGYTLPMHLYLGGNFTDFTGSDAVSAWLLEFQVGYDIGLKAAPVLIRPYAGLGYESFVFAGTGAVPDPCAEPGVVCTQAEATAAAAAANGTPSVSYGGVVFSPGVLGTYFFTPHWFAGVDIRLDISAVTAYGGATIDLYGIGGYKF